MSISNIIEPASSVLEVCSGPCDMHFYLKKKNCQYLGVDFNPVFIKSAVDRGIPVKELDVRRLNEITQKFDYVIMQASLYHFFPNVESVIKDMSLLAKKAVIISEPIRNVSSSKSKWLGVLGKILSNPGDGTGTFRFNEESLARTIESSGLKKISESLMPGGREKIYVLQP